MERKGAERKSRPYDCHTYLYVRKIFVVVGEYKISNSKLALDTKKVRA